jgi:hypothetical protein
MGQDIQDEAAEGQYSRGSTGRRPEVAVDHLGSGPPALQPGLVIAVSSGRSRPGARVITATEWAAFIAGVRAGEFD